MPLAALLRRGRADEARQLLQGVHAEGARPFQQRVQHVHGGPGVGQRAVARLGGAEEPGQRGQLVVGRLVPGQQLAGQLDGVEDGMAGRG
nr:hypothetical protein GCM10020093_112440 [Planobispora longispora]